MCCLLLLLVTHPVHTQPVVAAAPIDGEAGGRGAVPLLPANSTPGWPDATSPACDDASLEELIGTVAQRRWRRWRQQRVLIFTTFRLHAANAPPKRPSGALALESASSVWHRYPRLLTPPPLILAVYCMSLHCRAGRRRPPARDAPQRLPAPAAPGPAAPHAAAGYGQAVRGGGCRRASPALRRGAKDGSSAVQCSAVHFQVRHA